MSEEATPAVETAPVIDNTIATASSWSEILGEPSLDLAHVRSVAYGERTPEEVAEDAKGASLNYFDEPAAEAEAEAEEEAPAEETPTEDAVVEAETPEATETPEEPAVVEEEPTEPVVVATTEDGYEITEEDFDQILSSPAAFAEILTLHGRHVKAAVLAELRAEIPGILEPQTLEKSRMASGLFYLEMAFPDMDENVLLVALNEASKKNTGARLGALVKTAKEDIEAHIPSARAAADNAKRHDLRGKSGQFRTTTPGARTDRAGGATPAGDPTQQAFADMRRLNLNQ